MSEKGIYRAICDVCGFKYYAHELRKRWDGLMVCPHDWEARHEQDFIKVRPEYFKLPFTRSESTDVYIFICTMAGRHPYAGFAQAGCAEVGLLIYSPTELLLQYVCSPTTRLPIADIGTADCMTLGA